MKIWPRHILGLAGIFATGSVLSVELQLDSWRQETDQNVIRILGENSEGDGVLLLTKMFLDPAWGERFSDRLNSDEYMLVDSKTAASVSLFKAERTDSITIGKSFFVNQKYVIPVVKLNAAVDLYEYSPDSAQLSVISLDLEPTALRIESAYALSSGIVVVSSKGSSVAATHYPFDEQQERVSIDLGENPLQISDVIEMDSRVFILTTIRGSQTQNLTNPSVAVFDRTNLEERIGSISLAEYAAASVTSGFIPTSDSTPAIWTIQTNRFTDPPRLSVVDLNGAEVWSTLLDTVLTIENINLVEACSDKYVYGEVQTIDPPARKHILLSLATPESDLTFLNSSFLPRESGIIIDLHFFASDMAVYAITNYKQYEETRRSDGFYGWQGFNVFEISKDKSCNLGV